MLHLLAFAIAGHAPALVAIATALALLAGTTVVASHPNPLLPSNSPDVSTAVGQAANVPFQYEILTGTTDVIQGGGGGLKALPGSPAIPICGTSFIEASGVDACTLAAPVAGDPALGGNDGLEITIVDVGGHAHTVTAPANTIVPAHHLITWAGTSAGGYVVLVARNGKWYPLANNGVTIS